MGTRKGRRIAVVTVLAVILLAGALVWLSRDHIRFFLAFEQLGPNAQGYAEYRHRQTGIVFVALPGATSRKAQRARGSIYAAASAAPEHSPAIRRSYL